MNRTSPLYQYSFSLPFEKHFTPTAAKSWIEDNFKNGFYCCVIYIFVIFSLKRFMRDRKPFKLSNLLIIWNVLLSAFSISAFLRTVPEFLDTYNSDGVYGTICDTSYLTDNKVASFWSFMFVLSKLPEFGDTLFIVLRKQPLIFLHWYHHIATLLYSWYAFGEFTPSARWFIVMNTLIHSFMYSYYACRALKLPIPRPISVLITFLQICQMVAGCYVNFKTYQYLAAGIPCNISVVNVTVSSIMYISYFLLFSKFFYDSYIGRTRKPKRA